jgi:hypothetical protein
MTLILDSINQAFGTTPEANKAQETMLFMCTSVLSSLDTLVL